MNAPGATVVNLRRRINGKSCFYVHFFSEDHKTETVQLDEAEFVRRT
jgi:hypothetical protein